MSTVPLYDRLRFIIELRGKFTSTPRELNLVGVRGWLNGRRVPNSKDAFNDTIFAVYVNHDGAKCVEAFVASVEPGVFAERYNVAGDAHLVDGQYAFRRGLHRGYPALIQAEAVTIWRDRDKDGVQDASERRHHVGWYGINIHAAGTGAKVGNWSAGCQVIHGGRGPGSPWSKFMALVDASPQQVFRYTLVDGTELEREASR